MLKVVDKIITCNYDWKQDKTKYTLPSTVAKGCNDGAFATPSPNWYILDKMELLPFILI